MAMLNSQMVNLFKTAPIEMSVSGRDPDVQGREVVAGGRVKHPNAADTKPRSGARDGNSSKKAPEKIGEVWQKCPLKKIYELSDSQNY